MVSLLSHEVPVLECRRCGAIYDEGRFHLSEMKGFPVCPVCGDRLRWMDARSHEEDERLPAWEEECCGSGWY